jgi:hypothetical protein
MYCLQEETPNINDPLETLNNWEACKWQKWKCGYGSMQHWIVNCLWYKEREGPGTGVYGVTWKYEGLLKEQRFKHCKLLQLDKVLYRSFSAMRLKGKPMIRPMIIDKAKSFHDKVKMTDRQTLCEGWLQNFIEPAAEDVQKEYSLD